MDQTLSREQKAIREILSEIAKVQVFGDIQFKTVFDDEQKRYQVIATGWENDKQILRNVALLEIQSDLVWLQADNTDYGIAEQLIKRGIGQQQIVLGFHPAKWRQQTGFATGENT
jgi:hypothetical protein